MIHDPLMAQGAAQQLGAMIDRAQDERLRLMRIVKDYQAKYDALPEPVSADHVKRLMEAVRKLDAAIADRLATLDELDQRVDTRLDQMARIEASLLDMSDRVAKQLEDARGFQALVDAAKRQVRAAAAAAKAEFEAAATPTMDQPLPQNRSDRRGSRQPAAPTRLFAAEVPDRPLRNLAAIMNKRSG